ncbi:MAG: chaperone protein ClpB [Cyanobacteria bacterium QH_9_48_43]|jgi:ATP-dependent Clp protease ATP-binding subunit ClpC|nr:MAG: chaperone protein ClpB [Cyanobacteria bacterium QH_1_48_107]PSO55241.1 MAG: chaperone protein ClpB [Cyanobacteria bacterium QH_10_48_56]PSO59170.1 MAG: chaperone protein ClpB [Cyanobacteria bacterium QH_7_48_89]PSO74641.1 MAG: chaperone protein ClpB [Cyanobacteria bacterium QH_3_48_40]PSO85123.1 MAG: chaperone protein ClpB [Cyanobacteria bacterium QH_9_48_43]PSO99371.1 MAG: chaperone protein ClpB [Cyanobacteria bacterium SW_6_48_11]PSP14116.1 MAG: chaperone protein ClpB [Cyanobacteria
MFEHFTDKAIKVIMHAQEEARRMGQSLVGSEQILLGIIAEGTSTGATVLSDRGVKLEDARAAVENFIGSGSGNAPANIPFTPKAKRILEHSFQEARNLGQNYIAPEHLLLAIAQEEEGVATKVLQKLGVDPKQIQQELSDRSQSSGEEKEAATMGAREGASPFGSNQSKQANLEEYGTNLTKQAEEGKIDPVIGRAQEIERTIQILGRRTKNNPVLVGEPGVGKTAIAEGLAQRIVQKDIPELLQDKQVISLDMGLLVAGTRFRGEFEERLKGIINEVQEAGNIILVIDEIHTLVGAGAMEGGMDAANLLKPALARGELQCIGTTTLDEYRKHIEQDAALERRFQPIMVDEPSLEETIEILQGVRSSYEQHHRVNISEMALEAAAQLSERYISDRYLPDKAIDLIDEAGSRKHLKDSLEKKAAAAEAEEASDEEEAQDAAASIVDEEEIAQTISSWTGVPLNKLTKPESELLLHLEDTLHERLIGQHEAVSAVSRAIRRARVGMKDPNRPIASFIFSGPTGVGKTELTKALASYMFGSEEAMTRLDMSEYMEPHTTSKLVGSPPGYVGYGEGGQLTEAIRRQPYSVVLLDEVEKAHPDVFNTLLQILEDGRLTDAKGRVVDFKNTLLIMTSNIGSKAIEKGGGGLGFEFSEEAESQYNRVHARVMEEIKGYFRPEFINRLDEIIVFRQLNKEEVTSIADILLREISERLQQEREITLEVTEQFKERIVEEGYSSTYGARPLRRAIMRLLEDSLAEAILHNQVNAGDTAVVDVNDDGEVKVLPSQQRQPQLQAVS